MTLEILLSHRAPAAVRRRAVAHVAHRPSTQPARRSARLAAGADRGAGSAGAALLESRAQFLDLARISRDRRLRRGRRGRIRCGGRVSLLRAACP